MKRFFNYSSDIDKAAFCWNIMAGLLSGFQSVIMLIFLTRIADLTIVGMFTLANASANLFLYVGRYGVRVFQSSDVIYTYSFVDYHVQRIIAVAAMFASSAVYVILAMYLNGYSGEKSAIIFLMCLFKLPDAYEDVFCGEFQRSGRLDIAGKMTTVRLAVTTILFIFILCKTKNLLSALASSIFTGFLMLFFLLYETGGCDLIKGRASRGNVWNLTITCTPLFLNSILLYYIVNVPKYSIDAHLGDEAQAVYGFISMPVSIVVLISSIIFTPFIVKISECWVEGSIRRFRDSIIRQTMIVSGVLIVCLVGTYFAGVPMLSLLYHTDLTQYKADLMLIIFGGGMLAVSSVYANILTIMRQQIPMLISCVNVAVLALISSPKIIASWGIRGAVIHFIGLIIFLCMLFLGIIIYTTENQRRKML